MAPFVLICGHAFCRSDISKLSLNGTQNFCCPICQRLVNLDYYEASFPPKNFALIEQLKYLTSKPFPDVELARSELCAECDDNKASIFCQECNFELCDHCDNDLHKHRVFLNHHRLPIEKKPAAQPALQMCSLHPDEKLKLFCDEKECRTAICFECCSDDGTHKAHSSKRMEVVIATEKGRLSAALESCVSEMGRLQSLSESRSMFVAALLDQEERFLYDLHRDVESCLQAVRAKEIEIKQALRSKVAGFVRRIGEDLIALTDTRVTACALCQRAEETKSAKGASFVCSSREVTDLLEACVSQSTELIALKSLVPFELDSLRYLKPLASTEDGPLTGAVLSVLSEISSEDLYEENENDLIVSRTFPLSFNLFSLSHCRCLGQW
jgi:hypothetical protein